MATTTIAGHNDETRRGFPITETHGIAGWQVHRLLADSSKNRWSDVYTSHVRETSWDASLLASRHPCLAFCTSGSAQVRRSVEGEHATSSLLGTRQFGIVPADRASTWSVEGSPDVQHVYVRRDTFDDVIRDDLELDPADIELDTRVGIDDALLEQLAATMLQALKQPNDDDLLISYAARLMVLQLVRHHSNRGTVALRSDRPVRTRQARISIENLRGYIDANLCGDTSLTTLALAAGVPATTLSAQFTRQTGVTLRQYLLQRRLTRAAQLLAKTDRPIVEIAYDTGFSHQSHMTNTFRHKLGITPGAYRRERR